MRLGCGGELPAHELVDGLAVHALSGQLRHGRLHDAAHVFRRRRAGFRDGVGHGPLDRRGIDRRRQVGFEHDDLGRFLVGEILAAAVRELFDRISSLLDERVDDLQRLAVVERAAALDFAVHQRRLQHAQRAQPERILLAHRVGDRFVQVVDEGHAALAARPERGRGDGWVPGCCGGAGTIMPGTETPPNGDDGVLPAGAVAGATGGRPIGGGCSAGAAPLTIGGICSCGFTTCGCGKTLNPTPRFGTAAPPQSAPNARRRCRRQPGFAAARTRVAGTRVRARRGPRAAGRSSA